jgi:Flp pilus assembly protein TadB
MESGVLLGMLVLAGGAGLLAFMKLQDKKKQAIYSSFRAGRGVSVAKSPSIADHFSSDLSKLNQAAPAGKKGGKPSFEDMLIQAGVFSPEERLKFERIKLWGPLGGGLSGLAIVYGLVGFSGPISILFPVLFTLAGLRAHVMMLESRQKWLQQEILFYLPTVIEQMVIGVSSSLDIGPCIQKIVDMAFERDKSNPVVELLDKVLTKVRAGHSLDESLTEIAERMQIADLKHVFGAIAQVSRHGGEVTKQLQELADAVTTQREVQVETVIKKLELRATGPVAIAFLAFLATLFTGIGCMFMNQTM